MLNLVLARHVTLPRGMFLTADSFETSTPINLYASIAFSNLVTTVCQYEVLKYLSFAVSTLAKCAKIIPVMVWGRIILHKRYTTTDFISAGAVTAGCFIFVLDRGALHPGDGIVRGVTTGGGPGLMPRADGGPPPPPLPLLLPPRGGSPLDNAVEYHRGVHHSGAGGKLSFEDLDEMVTHPFNVWFESVKPHSALHQYILGTVIMLVYLGFDGFTSTFQQKLFRQYTTSILNQIFFTTCFSSIFSLVWLLTTSQLTAVTSFLRSHPQAVPDIFVLSVASCASQFTISYTIFCFGAVTLASVMTFRQFLSVVISCFLFGNPLSVAQWFGVLLVLAPVAQRVYQEQREPEIFAVEEDVAGGKRGQSYDSIEASPRPGMGLGSVFSSQSGAGSGGGVGHRSSANFDVDGASVVDPNAKLLHGRM